MINLSGGNNEVGPDLGQDQESVTEKVKCVEESRSTHRKKWVSGASPNAADRREGGLARKITRKGNGGVDAVAKNPISEKTQSGLDEEGRRGCRVWAVRDSVLSP